MTQAKKSVIFLCLFCAWGASLGVLDRKFLKANKNFSICSIYSRNSCKKSEVDAPLPEGMLDQPFFYLDRGHQTYAFVSQDNRYVLKFYHFPSHLRPFGWLNHPFGGKRRQKVIEYNLQKLTESFRSYTLAFENLRESCGLLYLHLHPTSTLKKRVHLIDHLGASYHINLDEVSFLLQKKVSPFFPTLETLIQNGKGKSAIAHFFALIEGRSALGISDQDPILEKNYGWDGERPVHLDVGRFSAGLKDPKEEKVRVANSLKMWLERHHPELLSEYHTRINAKTQWKESG